MAVPGRQNNRGSAPGSSEQYVPALGVRTKNGEAAFHPLMDNPIPLEKYLSILGKFRHLSKTQIEHLKSTAIRRLKLLEVIAEQGVRDAEESRTKLLSESVIKQMKKEGKFEGATADDITEAVEHIIG